MVQQAENTSTVIYRSWESDDGVKHSQRGWKTKNFTLRYPAKCNSCGGAMPVGALTTQINWEKGRRVFYGNGTAAGCSCEKLTDAQIAEKRQAAIDKTKASRTTQTAAAPVLSPEIVAAYIAGLPADQRKAVAEKAKAIQKAMGA